MTDARARALAAIDRADQTLNQPEAETEAEWAARAPSDPDAIYRWLREAPPHRPAVILAPPAPPPPPAGSDREVAQLRRQVAQMEEKLRIATSRKGREAAKSGRGYLTADIGEKRGA